MRSPCQSKDLHHPERPPVIVILGPTAVGKTEVSIQVAERMKGEIISADSRLFYKGMDIGTAKPTKVERSRVIHHLIDVAEPDEVWSLAQFQSHSTKIINQIFERHHLPFIVGGTGQYIQAIVQGWKVPEVEPNVNLRRALEDWGDDIKPQGLHDRLSILDPSAALMIDPHNVRRTIRALEVILSTGEHFSTQRKRDTPPYNVLQIGLCLPRLELYKRIDQRIEIMVEKGFEREVRSLLQKGYSQELPTMSAIGYSEFCSVAMGKITLDEAVSLMKKRTRNYVRRQANWFKQDDPEISWFNVDDRAVDKVIEKIETWLFDTYGSVSFE